MNVSNEEARNSLDQIQAVASRTRKTIAASYASPLLILWGLICITAYLGTHFFLAWAWHIWMGLDAIGIIGTFLICWQQFRSGNPTKVPASEKIGCRIFWFWTLLGVYILIWLNLLAPVNGLQMNAFIVAAVMFAYIVIGLWFACYFMVWLGLAVTCTTLLGFYVIGPNYYCLWMAATAGGALLGTGLYIRFRWR